MREDSDVAIPEPVDLDAASAAFRDFYQNHFVDTLVARRNEFDWSIVKRFRKNEVALARRLVRANLDRGAVYLDAAGLLNDREAIPALHDLLERARHLSARIVVARALWFLERAPEYPLLIERLVRSTDAALKLQHFWDILILADERALDHLLSLAEDRDESVRKAALDQLTTLSEGRFRRIVVARRSPHDLPYFRLRRDNPRFRQRMLRALKRDHDVSPVIP